ncbi:Citrate synthase [Burkholderia sp. OK233]|nr:Citrate synthase [Burkholderia sp. OK233]
MSAPFTSVGTPTSDISRLLMRGTDVLNEIVGQKTFTETFYFILTGRFPNLVQLKVLDAALVVLMDHGLSQSAVVARMIADSAPGQIQIALAGGAMMIGEKFAGTMAGTAALLREAKADGREPREWAQETVVRFQRNGRRIPGFGHPYYKDADPRAARLLKLAEDAGVEGTFLRLLKVLSDEINLSAGRPIVMNATAVLGAMLCEIDFPETAIRSVAVISRMAGLAAHVCEEVENPVVPALIGYANSIQYRDPD